MYAWPTSRSSQRGYPTDEQSRDIRREPTSAQKRYLARVSCIWSTCSGLAGSLITRVTDTPVASATSEVHPATEAALAQPFEKLVLTCEDKTGSVRTNTICVAMFVENLAPIVPHVPGSFLEPLRVLGQKDLRDVPYNLLRQHICTGWPR